MRVPCLIDGIYDYEPPHGGLLDAGLSGPDTSLSERSQVTGCDRLPRGAVSGPASSTERAEAFLKLARAL